MTPYIIGGIFVAIVMLVILGLLARYLSLWVQCYFSKAGISLVDLVIMSIRKVNPSVIVRGKIMAVQSGLTDSFAISSKALQAHYLAGGNVQKVIKALVAAHKAKIDIDWQVAQAIDLLSLIEQIAAQRAAGGGQQQVIDRTFKRAAQGLDFA